MKFIPKFAQEYWFIEDGKPWYNLWYGWSADIQRLRNGNCFETIKNAKTAIEEKVL